MRGSTWHSTSGGPRALDERTVRERIERIGYTAFDEMRTVLAQEAFLLPPVSTVSEYVEFAAVFFELRYSAPDVWPSYFPSLDDIDRTEGMMAEDVDIECARDDRRTRPHASA